MKTNRLTKLIPIVFFLFFQQGYSVIAQIKVNASTQNDVQRMEWQVDGVTREALVYIPPTAKDELTPIVFAFHGRGLTMENSSTRYNFQNLWTEAITVYPQGLVNTGVTIKGEPHTASTRWQVNPGDDDDRDLKFFDAMLDYFNKNYKIRTQGGVYLTGHSNGGGFAYLLWAKRANAFAAIALTSAQMSRYSSNAAMLQEIIPVPVFILAGTSDTLVYYSWAEEVIQDILKLNQCTDNKTTVSQNLTLYESLLNKRTMTYIHSGGHAIPTGVNLLMVDFFKQATAGIPQGVNHASINKELELKQDGKFLKVTAGNAEEISETKILSLSGSIVNKHQGGKISTVAIPSGLYLVVANLYNGDIAVKKWMKQ